MRCCMARNPKQYTERTYRNRILKNNLSSYNVTIRETDLFISSNCNLQTLAYRFALNRRSSIENFIKLHPSFLTSLSPVPFDDFAPEIVKDMIAAAIKANVGPMAAVAGAIAEHVGRDLLPYSQNVIVENGGDIFINSESDLHVGIFSGMSPFSDRLSIFVKADETPIGICTSSGTVGHSFSFGNADAVCVKAKSVSLADAAATAVANKVKSKKDIAYALEEGMKIESVQGIVIVIADQFGVIGNIELSER